jgi:hypothetical protein
MNRRGFLRTALCAAGATVGAMLTDRVEAKEPTPTATITNAGITYTPHADGTVTLERLWRIKNDPEYVNFGRYGTDAESMARTGKSSVWPEYDPAFDIVRNADDPGGWFDYAFLDRSTGRRSHIPFHGLSYTNASVKSQELTQRVLYTMYLAHIERARLAESLSEADIAQIKTYVDTRIDKRRRAELRMRKALGAF